MEDQSERTSCKNWEPGSLAPSGRTDSLCVDNGAWCSDAPCLFYNLPGFDLKSYIRQNIFVRCFGDLFAASFSILLVQELIKSTGNGSIPFYQPQLLCIFSFAYFSLLIRPPIVLFARLLANEMSTPCCPCPRHDNAWTKEKGMSSHSYESQCN